MAIIHVKIENNLKSHEKNPMWSKDANIKNSLKLSAQGAAFNEKKASEFGASAQVLKSVKPYFNEFEFIDDGYLLKLGDNKELSVFGKNIRNKVILKIDQATSIEFVNAKIDVSQQNTIIKTPLVGRVGTIKEYIAAEDHNIKITGDLFSSMEYRESYPYDLLITLLEILKKQGRIIIASKYLEAFNVHYMVLQRYVLNQSTNKYINSQHFDLDFISDLNEDYFSIED